MMEMGESIRSAIFVAEETPPVPPRRKKRKSKAMPIAGPSRTVHYKKRLPPPPPPLPPPPPPPPLPHLRKSKFRSCTSPIIIQKENRHAQAQVGEAEKSPREKNYPSLFFTISDFENVMRDSLSGGKKLLDTSVYSGENELTTSFIENPTIEEDAFFSSSPTIDGKERNFVEEEQSVSPLESTFDEENEVCFRVTTTNLPFEKCLKRWDFDNRRSSYEEDRSNDFIFQDYMDRSNKANIIKSKLNFSSENFNSIEESKPHSPTRVRFVIESPSTSASEYKSLVDSNEAYRELQNVESLLNESEENCEESEEKTTDFDKFSDFALDLKATSEFVLTESSMILSNFTNTSEIDDDSKDKDLAKLVEEAQTHEGLGDSTEKDYNVNERRNSFLETMLSDDQRGTCEIIAARLKIVKIPEERSVDDSRSIAEKNVEAKRNLADKKVEAKSVGEAKSDVLDELLKNFNTIKLKPVGHVVPEEKKMATPASVDGGGLAEEAFRISIDNKEDNDEIVRTTCVNSTDNETDSRYDENRVNYQHAICSGVQLSENELESGAGTKDKNRNDGEDVVESLAISLKSSKQDEREKGEISEKWDDAEDAVSAGGKVEGDRCEDEEIAEVLANHVENSDKDPAFDRGGSSNAADSCAIIRKTPEIHCNNNDNKRAVTPVAVSNDQSSREIFSIVPGSVRSFVQYYEIQQEMTSKDSKRIDSTSLVNGRSGRTALAGQQGFSKTENTPIKVKTTSGTDKKIEDSLSDLNLCMEGESAYAEEWRKTESRNSAGSLPKSSMVKRKKSVQFEIACMQHEEPREADARENLSNRVVAPSEREDSTDDQGSELVSRVIHAKTCTGISSSASRCQELAAQNHAGRDKKDEILNSGTDCFAVNSEKPHLVFYCTV